MRDVQHLEQSVQEFLPELFRRDTFQHFAGCLHLESQFKRLLNRQSGQVDVICEEEKIRKGPLKAFELAYLP